MFSARFGDADTSEMEGAADTMPTVSESMPLLTMTANGSALLSPTLMQGNLFYYFNAIKMIQPMFKAKANDDGVKNSGD